MKKTGDSDWTVSHVAANNGFAEQVAHLTGAIEGKHPLAITAVDGVRAMEVILSVYPRDGVAPVGPGAALRVQNVHSDAEGRAGVLP